MSGLPHLTGREMTLEEKTRLHTLPLGELMPWVFYSDPNGLGPDLLVGRRPAYMLPVGRKATVNEQYKVVFVETQGDRAFVENALCKPLVVRGCVIHFTETIDKTNMRPSTRPTGSPAVVLYEPPADGWPWYVLYCLPFNLPGEGMGRHRYANDAFDSESAALDHLAKVMNPLRMAGIGAHVLHAKGR